MISLEKIFTYRYVIFDMDGTLINSEPFHHQSWRDVAAQYQIPPLTTEFMLSIGGMTARAIAEMIIRDNGLKAQPEDLIKIKDDRYLNHYMEEVECFPKMISLLNQVHEHGAKIGVATGSFYPESKHLLQKYGVFDLITTLISSDMIEHGKPAPDIYLKAAQGIGANPAEVLVFEDTPTGLKGVKAAGMPAIKVFNGAFDCDDFIYPNA